MKILFLTTMMASFTFKNCYKNEDIIGLWNLQSTEENGNVQFNDNNTFKMTYVPDDEISNTLMYYGWYVLKGENILLMRVNENEEYLKHTIEELTDSTLVIKYKEELSKYKR